jgi:hypothetical protein
MICGGATCWSFPRRMSATRDTPIASYVDPPLTTVRQDFVSEAIVGLAQLLDEIEGDSTEDRPRARPLPVQLTVRQSTEPLRRSRKPTPVRCGARRARLLDRRARANIA